MATGIAATWDERMELQVIYRSRLFTNRNIPLLSIRPPAHPKPQPVYSPGLRLASTATIHLTERLTTMLFFTQQQYDQLIQNGKDMGEYKDHTPVVRLYINGTGCTWLLTELCPHDPDIAFGLCDLGMGFPEIGYVGIQEITDAQGPSQRLERDLHFEGEYPISVYAEAARGIGQVTLNGQALKQAAYKP